MIQLDIWTRSRTKKFDSDSHPVLLGIRHHPKSSDSFRLRVRLRLRNPGSQSNAVFSSMQTAKRIFANLFQTIAIQSVWMKCSGLSLKNIWNWKTTLHLTLLSSRTLIFSLCKRKLRYFVFPQPIFFTYSCYQVERSPWCDCWWPIQFC